MIIRPNGAILTSSPLLASTTGTNPADFDIAPTTGASHSDHFVSDHFVQFYENDDVLNHSLADYLHAGLLLQDSCIVIATPEHTEGVDKALATLGWSTHELRATGQYLSLDAQDTLDSLLEHGIASTEKFLAVVGGLVRAARSQTKNSVRVFGEMVGLLDEEGKHDQAIRLEKMWNALQETYPFQLYCAYPLALFTGENLDAVVSNVCRQHTHTIPCESYSQLATPEARLKEIAILQQLSREILDRKAMESQLRTTKAELEQQVLDLKRVTNIGNKLAGIHDTGIILREVLHEAIGLQSADFGYLSLYNAEGTSMRVAAHSGFDHRLVQEIAFLPVGAGASGKMFDRSEIVVVEDTERDPIFADYRGISRKAGFRAFHSTPLVTRSGKVIGTITLQFRTQHRPLDRHLQLMALVARMSADIIENAKLRTELEERLREREALLLSEHAARTTAEAANRLKDEFIATVSHELRTPITAIISWAELLDGGETDQALLAQGLDSIQRNALGQSGLIDDLLDVSAIATGNLNLKIESVDASQIVQSTLNAARSAAQEKGVTLTLSEIRPLHIEADACRLKQIVSNLISNAIKFTSRGGSVSVELESVSERAVLTVTDTGEGISADFLPLVFDRFRQANGTVTRRHGGLGIGLAIVRHLVALHGGSINAHSEGAGRGATFRVGLPIQRG